MLETVEAFNAQGVAVLSLGEGFDMSAPMGKTILTMLSAMAELERSDIKERQLAASAAIQESLN